jgi:glycosyltransferase involved in cell wall biosynthesis
LWFPWNGCSWLNFSRPAVATLHDATSFVLPDYQRNTQVIFRNAAAHCCALITDSVFSACELARELAVPLDRFTPIPLGVNADPRKHATFPILREQPYVLFVGTAEKRKGIPTLIRAMERVQQDEPSLRLMIAGASGDGLRGDETVGNVLGFLEDDVLTQFYLGAEMFVFPSRYEGFGLPVLEAMSYGIPVITTHATALPEVAGDAALYVPVDDEAALADAIMRVHRDKALAASMRERGLARAAEMSWKKTAGATLDVLERAAS